MTLLDVRDLQVRFSSHQGQVKAVDGVNLQLDAGECLGIVGESGSGKTVTAMSIMRLLPASLRGTPDVSGQVIFDGEDLMSVDDARMRQIRGRDIAMIFQDPMTALNPVLTIGQQIEEPLRHHLKLTKRAARKQAVEMLKTVGIPGAVWRAEQYPHQYSGGMRQRAMIAMMLACGPRLVIADEPTTALDVTVQAQILELIRDLQREREMAVIMVSHDLGVIAGIADRVHVMYAGRIVEEGSAEDMYQDPRMPYTIGLMRSMPRADLPPTTRLNPIPGYPPDLAALTPGCPFAPRCEYAQDVCQDQRPTLRTVGTGQRAACHFDLHAPAAVRVGAGQ